MDDDGYEVGSSTGVDVVEVYSIVVERYGVFEGVAVGFCFQRVQVVVFSDAGRVFGTFFCGCEGIV